jgi:hypothetical protein
VPDTGWSREEGWKVNPNREFDYDAGKHA